MFCRTLQVVAWGIILLAPLRADSTRETAPSSRFDLSHWKLQLPTPSPDGSGKVEEIPPATLAAGFSKPPYFYLNPDGAMVFACPVNGVRTPDASYPRTELREMIDPNNYKVNWSVAGTHVLTATCQVDQVPGRGKVIVGQIHGIEENGLNANPLVKLQFEEKDGTCRLRVLVKETAHGPRDNSYDGPEGLKLNEPFRYEIKAVDGVLTVKINDVLATNEQGAPINDHFVERDPGWAKKCFYFKAGAYCQDNKGDASQGAKVLFFKLTCQHVYAATR